MTPELKGNYPFLSFDIMPTLMRWESSYPFSNMGRYCLQTSLALPLLPHVTMAVCLSPLSDPRAEITILEINQELCSQLAKSEQDFQDLTEKFLVSQATAYSLANQLQKYTKSFRAMCGEYQDLIESVLREKLHLEEGKLAEQSCSRADPDAAEVTGREKDISILLSQHLNGLLTHEDSDNYQGQGFREQLAEGHRLVERIDQKLSPSRAATGLIALSCSKRLHSQGIFFQLFWSPCHIWGHTRTRMGGMGLERTSALENHEDEENEEEKASLDLSRELQEKEEMNDVIQDSLDEQCLTLPSHHDLSDSCHCPDRNQKDHEEEERHEPMVSSHHDLYDSHQLPKSTTVPSDEHVCSALDVTSEYSIVKRMNLQKLSPVASTFFALTPLSRSYRKGEISLSYSIGNSRTSSPTVTLTTTRDRASKNNWLRDRGWQSTLPTSSAQLSCFPCHIWGHDRTRTGWVGAEKRNAQCGSCSVPTFCFLPDGQGPLGQERKKEILCESHDET
ncbi:hypothetical protein HPG69_002743 [Diceros bicornis minor]|uniref:Olduvai domain-containing protein n=1 Tax=Diceros bicornis minor TaxID=77932 RepID=A0A7J7FLQ3_DICBM|nr:hypothetical protein HPG69_002743 [Diceros bicornis minor]